ncbi:UPF0468 protein C16orf80-like [Papilio xuthus]|uniref:UPF0468 protein C16orf80-like n=1 Tax=Papilio xuthus TaxID=66420 RepID=A0A194QIN2_PAPXU|nr:UPF0468 protein C16orf80-like [Papilio xuthus]
MFRKVFQRGMVTIFFSVGSKPLDIWETHIKDGYITKFLDQDIKSMVYEIRGTNVSTTYIKCPKGNQVLGINLPYMVMIVKNLKKYFTFEVIILDNTGARRRFRVSNFQSTTQILPLCTVMPIGLADDWNQIQFNLAEFTRRAYNKQFVEVQNVKINANIRLRRIYFTERLVHPDELPNEYKLFFPIDRKARKEKMIRPSQTEMPKVNVSKTSVREQDAVAKAPSEHSLEGKKKSKASLKESVTKAPTEQSVEGETKSKVSVKGSMTKTSSVRSVEGETKSKVSVKGSVTKTSSVLEGEARSKENLTETMEDIPDQPIEAFINAILDQEIFDKLKIEEA